MQFYTPTPLTKAYQPRLIRSHTEVKKILKEMKNNEASGTDNLTSDVMILGEEESVKQITFFKNLDLREKKDTS